MPDDEGMALYRAARLAVSSRLGPLLEVGTYCGKSAVYLGSAAAEAGCRPLLGRPPSRGSGGGTRPGGTTTIPRS